MQICSWYLEQLVSGCYGDLKIGYFGTGANLIMCTEGMPIRCEPILGF
jgi:hypothetical protein